MSDSFTPRPRVPRDGPGVDRWPAIEAALRGLLGECEAIVARGRDEFDAVHSLTFRASEAVIIHFHDLVGSRMPRERLDRLPVGLPLSAIAATRNVLAHNYRAADTAIVWAVMVRDLPDAIRALVDEAEPSAKIDG